MTTFDAMRLLYIEKLLLGEIPIVAYYHYYATKVNNAQNLLSLDDFEDKVIMSLDLDDKFGKKLLFLDDIYDILDEFYGIFYLYDKNNVLVLIY